LDTYLDTNQSLELSEVIKHTTELVIKDKQDRVIIYLDQLDIFESIPAKWKDIEEYNWAIICKVCAG